MSVKRIRGRALQKIRKRIMRRDNGLCGACLLDGTITPCAQDGEIDHMVALTNGGQEVDSNRWLLCPACHLTKTRADLGSKPKGCDATGWPSDPRHHWNAS